jgi:hypothetical protein
MDRKPLCRGINIESGWSGDPSMQFSPEEKADDPDGNQRPQSNKPLKGAASKPVSPIFRSIYL